MRVRQEQLKERGYFINKKGEKCTGLGAAAENYKLDEAKQAEGRLKYSRTRAVDKGMNRENIKIERLRFMPVRVQTVKNR